MSMTDAAEAGCLNHTLGGTPWGFPAAIYAAWNTADPGDGGSQTAEIGRTQMTGFDAAAAGVIQNTNLISVDTTGWSDTNPITHVGMVSTATLGTYFWSEQLTNPISFTAGELLEIPAGGFIFRFNNAATPSAFHGSELLRNKWLDHIFGTTSWTQPTSPRVHLHTDDPGTAGTANEFTGGGYAPQAFSLSALDTVATATRGRNSNAISFLNSQSTPIAWWTIRSQTSAEFLYTYDQTDKTVAAGATIDVPVERLEVLVT